MKTDNLDWLDCNCVGGDSRLEEDSLVDDTMTL
jgi:hypothetical protein